MMTDLACQNKPCAAHSNRFSARRPKTQALGMGLAVVHSIVRSHEGQVLLESQEDVGSTVTIWLPVDDDNRKSNLFSLHQARTRNLRLAEQLKYCSSMMTPLLGSGESIFAAGSVRSFLGRVETRPEVLQKSCLELAPDHFGCHNA